MSASTNDNVSTEIGRLPEILREPVQGWFERLDHHQASWREASIDVRTLVRLVASSEFAASVALREWQWLADQAKEGGFDRAPDTQQIITFAQLITVERNNVADLKSQLRCLRNRQMLHILWRTTSATDSAKSLAEALQSLSDLADILIRTSIGLAESLLMPRFGSPLDEDGERIPMITLAMGKLGGRELNFSSDVDLIFLYPVDGETDGRRQLSAHEYFVRLSRQVVSLLDDVTEDGFVYRVDTRLRPFGESGPPVVSFAALESYLLQHGRGWERYAYIKARVITPSRTDKYIDDLQDNMIEPFVYRRYLDYGVFDSLRGMKELISTEVRKRELADNIKLGPGGIREIEFIAQSLQLVRGGRDEQLRCCELQSVLPRLGKDKGIQPAAVRSLLDAYSFLRRFENAIQALRDQQTHDVPEDAVDQARVLVGMNYTNWIELASDLNGHRDVVSQLFAAIAIRENDGATGSDLANLLAALWQQRADQSAWASTFVKHEFAHAEKLADIISHFANEPVIEQIGATAQRRLRKFIPALLMLLRDGTQPHVVCERVLHVAQKILRRSAYVALLNENPASMQQLVSLCEQSGYLAEEIARFPLLLDEMLDPRLYSGEITAASMRADLAQRIDRSGEADSEQKIEILAQFQRATLFRVAIADISGNLPIMQVSDRLTELAEIVLHYALDVAWSDLVSKHGVPQFVGDSGGRAAGLGVIAYGKLGGMELSYRSDLDLVFLHDSSGDGEETDGPAPLENSMFFVRLVRRLVHFLTTQTQSGALYEVDTRLRPSGQSGLLVVNTEGFERYQEENAWTWEHQALLRARAVAGSDKVAREFENIRSETLRNRVRRDSLLDDVRMMRAKMRTQLDKSTADRFDLKQGEGGVGDIEFLVQYLVLKYASENPAVIHYPDNIRQLGALGAAGFLAPAEVQRLQESYRRYRLRLHRLSLNEEAPLVDSTEFTEERQFVVAMWQRKMR